MGVSFFTFFLHSQIDTLSSFLLNQEEEQRITSPKSVSSSSPVPFPLPSDPPVARSPSEEEGGERGRRSVGYTVLRIEGKEEGEGRTKDKRKTFFASVRNLSANSQRCPLKECALFRGKNAFLLFTFLFLFYMPRTFFLLRSPS